MLWEPGSSSHLPLVSVIFFDPFSPVGVSFRSARKTSKLNAMETDPTPTRTFSYESDELDASREELWRTRQRMLHDLFRGTPTPGLREKYLAIRDREALLDYGDLKARNRRDKEARVFDRPRKTTPTNRRLRIWLNLLMIAMVLAVLFFSVITPRLTSKPETSVREVHPDPPAGEMFP